MEQQIPVNTTPQQEQPEQTPSAFEELPEPLSDIAQMASEAFDEFKESDAYEKILDAKETAQNYIRENPVHSFFYALGAGTLLGFLLKRNK